MQTAEKPNVKDFVDMINECQTKIISSWSEINDICTNIYK